MARSVRAASGTSGAQLATGSGTLLGLSCQESAQTPAAATLIVRDGTDNTGAVLAYVQLGQGEALTLQLPAVSFTAGLFLDRTGGETEAVAYLL